MILNMLWLFSDINIEQNKFLVITKGAAVIKDKSFTLDLAKKIKNFVSEFQKQMKQKIAEEKERLMEELKKF